MKSIPFFLFLGVFAASYFGIGGTFRDLPSTRIGQPVPAFTAPGVPGVDAPGLATGDFQNGRVSIVNFWASWCVPCKKEHPFLLALANDHRWDLFGVNYRDSPANARSLLQRLGNPFARIGADGEGRTAISWGIYGIPETFIVDSDGIVRHRHTGAITARVMVETIGPLLRTLTAPREGAATQTVDTDPPR